MKENVRHKRKLIAIWAEDENGVIGIDGRLPWHLPAELSHFKAVTMGNALLMGRKTFDGMNRRILPGRETYVLTRSNTAGTNQEEVKFFQSKSAVLNWQAKQDKALFVIGGAELLKLFDGEFDEIYQTIVHGKFGGDTKIPELTFEAYVLLSKTRHKMDEQNPYDFTIYHYRKK